MRRKSTNDLEGVQESDAINFNSLPDAFKSLEAFRALRDEIYKILPEKGCVVKEKKVLPIRALLEIEIENLWLKKIKMDDICSLCPEKDCLNKILLTSKSNTEPN